MRGRTSVVSKTSDESQRSQSGTRAAVEEVNVLLREDDRDHIAEFNVGPLARSDADVGFTQLSVNQRFAAHRLKQ